VPGGRPRPVCAGHPRCRRAGERPRAPEQTARYRNGRPAVAAACQVRRTIPTGTNMTPTNSGKNMDRRVPGRTLREMSLLPACIRRIPRICMPFGAVASDRFSSPLRSERREPFVVSASWQDSPVTFLNCGFLDPQDVAIAATGTLEFVWRVDDRCQYAGG